MRMTSIKLSDSDYLFMKGRGLRATALLRTAIATCRARIARYDEPTPGEIKRKLELFALFVETEGLGERFGIWMGKQKRQRDELL